MTEVTFGTLPLPPYVIYTPSKKPAERHPLIIAGIPLFPHEPFYFPEMLLYRVQVW